MTSTTPGGNGEIGNRVPPQDPLRKLVVGVIERIRDDRRILTTVIFPWFVADPGVAKILFVGCKWHTQGYNETFRAKEYWTIEIDPARSRYGAERHVVDSVANVRDHFDDGAFDLVICNGVFGWGLDGVDEVERAFEGCHAILKTGGVFMLGWNDIPSHRPFPLERIDALKLFSDHHFPPLGGSRYLTRNRNRHTYNFYRKP
jgi:SAM-dependent methyltransferase